MIRQLVFGGVSTLEFGVGISGESSFNAPGRDVSVISIVGRNGDLTIDNGRYKNIDVTYPAYIVDKFPQKVLDLRAYFCSQIGYQRLEDSYTPDTFRLGVFKKGLDFTTNPLNRGATFNLTFDCKPQRYLKSGEQTESFNGAITLLNPTRFTAKPIIRLHSTGTLTVNGNTFTVTSFGNGSYVDIDCEIMNCYSGSLNLNNYSSGTFPELVPGENTISFSGNYDITPRWWTL